MANNSGSGVPKFSSFKPKPKKSDVQVNNAESSGARNGARSDARNHRRDDGERQEVMMGRHRVEKSRSNRDRSRSPPRGPRHDDRHRNVANDRNTRQYASHTREDRSERHHYHPSHRDDEARKSQSYQQSFEDRSSDLYMIDVRGDLANSQYRQSNKWNIPLYYLFGSGSVVGHDPPRKQVVKRAGVEEVSKPSPKAEMAGGNDQKSAEEDFLPMPEQKKDKGESPFLH
jgi:hypothetical protein